MINKNLTQMDYGGNKYANNSMNNSNVMSTVKDVITLIKNSSYSKFESKNAKELLSNNISSITMIVIGYLTMIFFHALLLKQQKLNVSEYITNGKNHIKYNKWIKSVRFVWNLCFCIFSVGVSIHTVPLCIYQTFFDDNGNNDNAAAASTAQFLCSQPPSETFTEGPVGLWFLFYVLSKFLQMGNTIFLILLGNNNNKRGQLPFLHWFYHSTVVPYAWYLYVSNSSLSLYFVTMDNIVNAFLYGYLTIRDTIIDNDYTNASNGQLLSKKLRFVWGARVTMMQFAQLLLSLIMITKTFVHDAIIDYNHNNASNQDDDIIRTTCHDSSTSFIIFGGVYALYFALFVQYVDKKYKFIKKLGMLYYYYSYQLSTTWNNLNSKNESNTSTGGGAGGGGASKPWKQPGLSLEQQFNAASRVVPALAHFATPDDLSYLYARFKQATCGPVVKTDKDLSEKEVQEILDKQSSEKDKMKWKTWYTARHLTKEQCQIDYVAKVNEISELAQQKAAQSTKKKSTATNNNTNGNYISNINNDPMTLYPVQIISMGKYLPKRIVTNKEIEVNGAMEPGTLDKMRLGVIERRSADADNGESMVDMAVMAIKDAVSKVENMELNDIDLIINASGVVSQGIPDDACKVQRELGLGESGIPAFSVHATCLSFMVALDIAGSFMYANAGNGKYNNVVIYASVTPVGSDFLNKKDAHTAGLFGDAAVACILRRTTLSSSSSTTEKSSSCINRSLFETYGIGYELCQIQGGGSYRPPHHKLYVSNDTDKFKMNGPDTVKMISKIGAQSLNTFIPGLQFGLNNLSLNDDDDSENSNNNDKMFNIDWVVPHQASGLGLETLELLGWPKDKILRTLHKYGNTISVSIPLTLYDGIYNTKQIKRGDKILMTGTSAGVSFGCMLLTY